MMLIFFIALTIVIDLQKVVIAIVVALSKRKQSIPKMLRKLRVQ